MVIKGLCCGDIVYAVSPHWVASLGLRELTVALVLAHQRLAILLSLTALLLNASIFCPLVTGLVVVVTGIAGLAYLCYSQEGRNYLRTVPIPLSGGKSAAFSQIIYPHHFYISFEQGDQAGKVFPVFFCPMTWILPLLFSSVIGNCSSWLPISEHSIDKSILAHQLLS